MSSDAIYGKPIPIVYFRLVFNGENQNIYLNLTKKILKSAAVLLTAEQFLENIKYMILGFLLNLSTVIICKTISFFKQNCHYNGHITSTSGVIGI